MSYQNIADYNIVTAVPRHKLPVTPPKQMKSFLMHHTKKSKLTHMLTFSHISTLVTIIT